MNAKTGATDHPRPQPEGEQQFGHRRNQRDDAQLGRERDGRGRRALEGDGRHLVRLGGGFTRIVENTERRRGVSGAGFAPM